MTLPLPPGPPYSPTSGLVARGWLQLAVPYVRVGDRLPKVDEALRTVGFVRVLNLSGGVDRDVPFRRTVVTAECWVAPNEATHQASWPRAGQLAEWVLAATFDRALMGRRIEPSEGSYSPARVHTVIALGDPARVEDDPGGFARVDLDLQINWTAA